MLKQLSATEKVNYLFDKYKSNFSGFFHNMLWQFLVNETRNLNAKETALTPVIKDGHTELGIADKNRGGYTPTMVIFVNHNYDKACDVCDDLNKDLFGLTEEESYKITSSTMRGV